MARSRKRAALIAAATVASFLICASSALADVTPSMSLNLADNHLGAHSDATVRLDFNYGSIYPAQYPAPSDWRESVKDMVVDIPPGLVGNPNAIPMDERCDPEVFATGVCPDSATVGTFTIKVGVQQNAPAGPTSKPLSIVPITPTGPSGAYTKLSLLKT